MKSRIKRFGITAVGPMAVSGSNFLVSLILISGATPGEYGYFALTSTLIHFLTSATNATTATPLSILTNNRGGISGNFYKTLADVNLIVSSIFAVFSLLLGLIMGFPVIVSASAAAWTLFAGVRWFQRANDYANHNPHRAAWLDVALSVASIAVNLGLWSVGRITLLSCLGSLASIYSLAAAFLFFSGRRARSRSVDRRASYRQIWHQQSKWALIGVFIVEVTTNAYVYVVSILFGPTAYAPVAAAALLWRPSLTLFAAITSIERPALARAVATSNRDDILNRIKDIRLYSFCGVLVNAILVITIFVIPGKYTPFHQYSRVDLAYALAMFSPVIIIKGWRLADNVFVQASGHFRSLAFVGVLSAPISFAGALISAVVFGPIYSSIGTVMGELLTAYRTHQLVRAKKQ
jgi:hypothetical protein